MNYRTIGERITDARTLKGWKKVDLARAVNVSSAAVTQWEQGDTKGLKPENLVAVAHALEVLTDWLATGKGPMRNENPTPKEREALEDLRALEPETAAAIFLMIRTVRRKSLDFNRPKIGALDFNQSQDQIQSQSQDQAPSLERRTG